VFKLFRTEINAPFKMRLPISNLVCMRAGFLKHHSVVASLRAGKLHPWAPVILGQTMRSAELVAAVRTLKRKKSFLPTLSTFHILCAPFMLKIEVTVYKFPSTQQKKLSFIQHTKRLKPANPKS